MANLADGSLVVDIATLVFGFSGGAFGLWQYYRSNKEARARSAADELERFHADENVRTALRIIDWHSGFIPYIDDAGIRHQKRFSALDFHLAVRPHTKTRSQVRTYDVVQDHYRSAYENKGVSCEDLFSPTELYVRDVLDGFFARLERIESLIENGVVDQKSFGDNFSYWLKIIGDAKHPGQNLSHFSNEKREALLEYINHYEFDGVIRLFKRYGKIIRPATSLARADA